MAFIETRFKSLFYSLCLCLPTLSWAGNPSNIPNYTVDGIQRDAAQHVIGKTICNTINGQCTYYAFDAYGNLLMRCGANTKNVFQYDANGFLIGEIAYTYPEGISNYPEEELYIISQVSYKSGVKRAKENYGSLPKADEEFSPEELAEQNQKKQAERNIGITTLTAVGVWTLTELLSNSSSSNGGKPSGFFSSTSGNSYSSLKEGSSSTYTSDGNGLFDGISKAVDGLSKSIDRAVRALFIGFLAGILSVWVLWKLIPAKRK